MKFDHLAELPLAPSITKEGEELPSKMRIGDFGFLMGMIHNLHSAIDSP